MKYFLAVAREESITAAAASLHVTQPTLSKQLMELEAELGKKLFERGSRRITLTEDGLLLRKRAREIIDLVEKTECELSQTDEAVSGEVFIGGGETEGIRFVARAIRACRLRHPALRFNLYSGNVDSVLERLDKGLLDFALLIEPADIVSYEYLRLPYEDTFGVVLPKSSPLAKKAVVTPTDLLGIPMMASSRAAGSAAEVWMGTEREKLNTVLRFNLIYNAAVMVEEGIGYAFCLSNLANTSEESPLTFRPLSPPLHAGLVLAWKRNAPMSRASQTFLSAFRAELDKGASER